ncbi:Maltase 1 [Camponotus floridanus]|uniref:alpha-glucosidase n=1 Tax=Camponotus floridanus TaxID=104421 RepID=E2A8S6_CAMFO|nr:Maltase 1 [Camponotus floridanus]
MFKSRYHIFLSLLAVTLISGEILDRGWWNHTVFYQIYPRSFMDSDDDGVGDLKGITNKLEHFVTSGVGAIWLSPINRSPMVDFGYDISDFKDVDKIFGTMTDFENLLTRAKALGLRIILDLVPNHTSDEHYWFKESINRTGKYEHYYIWADGKGKLPPNNWLSVFGGSAWEYNSIRNQWYLHQFHKKQPDLNYTNPEVQEEMKETILYWLRKGVDGFRVDAVPHLFETNYTLDEPTSGIEDDYEYDSLNHIFTTDQPETYNLVLSWRKILDEYAYQHNTSEKVMLIEAYATLENTIKYYNYGSIPFNFYFITNATDASDASVFKDIIESWMKAIPKGSIANWVMGNHDRNRTASRFPGMADQMTMLAMILPGVAVTYYGEEIGMVDKTDITWEETQDPLACNAGREKYQSRSRDPVRTPFQWHFQRNAGFSNANKTWLPIHENYTITNLIVEQYQNESHYKVYRALTTLRNTSDALKFGSLSVDVINNNILYILRKTSEEAVTLLINFSKDKQGKVDLTRVLTGFKNGVIKVASVGSKLRQNQTVELNNISIPPKVSIVFQAYPSSKAPAEYVASLQTIILALSFLIITLYK